jgi:hypothetical protein
MLPPEIDILDGGEIEGALAFEVPDEVAAESPMMTYENPQLYDFRWIELKAES